MSAHFFRVPLLTAFLLFGAEARADEPAKADPAKAEPLPPPRVVQPDPVPQLVVPFPPPHPVYHFPQVSRYEVWQNYGVDRRGYFRPLVIYSPSGPYYRYNHAPYPWASTHEFEFMPYVVD
jgi:hypothetical protein